MSNRYGKVKEVWNSALKCKVVTVRSVVRKEFVDIDGNSTGSLLTPVEHIFMSCPLDKPKEA